MEDARQPIMDALSKASEQGLRTGFIVNSSMGTIVGTVYPKSADVEPPPRPEKVHAVDTSLRIQDALQTLNYSESSAQFGSKDGVASPASSPTERRTVVDIDECGTALARQQQPQQPPFAGMYLDRSGSTVGFGTPHGPGQVIRPEVQMGSVLRPYNQMLSAVPGPVLLRPDFLVNTVTAMRERRKLGGQSSMTSFQPPNGSSVCVTPFQPPTATPVGTPRFQVGTPVQVRTPVQVGTPVATPVGQQAFAVTPSMPTFQSFCQQSPVLVATPVGATPAFSSFTQTRGRQDTRDSRVHLHGEILEMQPKVLASEERGPPPGMVANQGAMASVVSTTPRRPPGTQSMVQLQSLSAVRATSPSSSSPQLLSPQYSRCVSARRTLHMTNPSASPEHNHLGRSLDESSQGPRPPAFSGGTRVTLASQPSSTRLTRNGAPPQAFFRSVSPPQERSPAPIIQAMATQPSERVLLRAVSPQRQRSPSPSRRQQIGADDVNENILNAQSRLLQSLRSTELYLAKMN